MIVDWQCLSRHPVKVPLLLIGVWGKQLFTIVKGEGTAVTIKESLICTKKCDMQNQAPISPMRECSHLVFIVLLMHTPGNTPDVSSKTVIQWKNIIF